MYIWWRLPLLIRRAKKAARVDVEAKTQIPLRVFPGDVDAYGHLNNGRYLTLCDLGRFDMSIRSGMMDVFHRKQWFPIVGSSTVRYRRSLELFHKFELSTQLIFWDDKWFYVEHQFIREGDIYCRVLIKGAVRSQDKKTIPMAEVVAALSETQRPPKAVPEAIRCWREMENHLR